MFAREQARGPARRRGDLRARGHAARTAVRPPAGRPRRHGRLGRIRRRRTARARAGGARQARGPSPGWQQGPGHR